MSPFITFVCVLLIGWKRITGEVVVTLSKNRSGQLRRKEDYSFESKLKRATEECSYIARTDDESHKEELIQKIKNEMNVRKVEEFYKQREQEKIRSKEYYRQIENEERRKFFQKTLPRLPGRGNFQPTPPPRRAFPHPSPPFLNAEFARGVFKRSPRSKDPSLTQGTFKDHSNCFSRCVFAGMELVDFLGFPDEASIRKALEDFVDNRRVRASKIRRAHRCFDEAKKVAIDDNCIHATKIFKCMGLDEPGNSP